MIITLATNAVLLYAGLQSFRALQTPSAKDDKQWLTFWLLFTVLEFATTFTDWIGWIIPFYSLGKLGLIIFLGFFNGATMLYPFLEPHLLKADKVAAKYEMLAKKEVGKAQTAVKTGVLQK